MPTLEHATRLASYRSISEDRVLVVDLEDRIVLGVFDGAGGVVGSGLAVDLTVGLVRDHAHELVDIEACIELLKEADAKVMKTGGETTTVLLVVHRGGLYGASCGDSEAWLIHDDGTIDEWLIHDDGTIDDLTQHQHLKRRLGSGRAVPMGFEREKLEGTLVVGSDGLFRYAGADKIASVVMSAATAGEAADAFVELVRTRSGLLDDVAVVLVKLGGR